MKPEAKVREREALGLTERLVAGTIGVTLVIIAIVLAVAPPSRRVALDSCVNAAAGCVVSVDGDVANLGTALMALGAFAVLVALLGIRFTSVKAAGVELGSNYEKAAEGLPKAEPQPSGNADRSSEPRAEEPVTSSDLPVNIEVVGGLGSEGVVPVAVTRLTEPMDLTEPRYLRDYQTARRHGQGSYFLTHVLGPAKTRGQIYSIAIRLIPHNEPDHDVKSTRFYLGRAWGGQVFSGSRGSDGRFGITTEAYGPFLVLCEVEFVGGDRILLDHYCDFEMGALLQS